MHLRGRRLGWQEGAARWKSSCSGRRLCVPARVERAVAGRQGAVLAALALNAGQPVSFDRLADVVWGDQPPAEAANALQQRIPRLPVIVDPERRGDVLVQVAGGYALNVDARDIDARLFEDLAAAGRRQLADGDLYGAEVTFTRALDLWRGAALEGFADEPWAAGEARRLDDVRLSVTEDRFEALLGQGAHGPVVGDLVDLTVAHPLRERLRAQLMLALYRAGRQGDALAVYEQTRRLLAEELGVDPGPQLQRLHRQILTQGPDLTVDAADLAVATTDGNLPVPRTSMVGRDHALEQVARLLDHARLLTVTGPGGAGKTTLAVEAARRRRAPPGGVWLVSFAPVSACEVLPLPSPRRSAWVAVGWARGPSTRRPWCGRWRADASCWCWTTVNICSMPPALLSSGCSLRLHRSRSWRPAESGCPSRGKWCGRYRVWAFPTRDTPVLIRSPSHPPCGCWSNAPAHIHPTPRCRPKAVTIDGCSASRGRWDGCGC